MTERDERELKPDTVSPFDKRFILLTIVKTITTTTTTNEKRTVVANKTLLARATVHTRSFATSKTDPSPKSFPGRRRTIYKNNNNNNEAFRASGREQ